MKLNQTINQDLEDLKFMKQMVTEAQRQLLFSQITEKEYQYILSRTIANLDILEAKHGMD